MGREGVRTGARAVVAIAACGLVAIGLADDRERRPRPASEEEIVSMIDRLAPACRPTGRRALRAALEASGRGWLDGDEARAALEPLVDGGPAACAAVDGQRFALGTT